MPDLIYRFDPDDPKAPPPPGDAAAAKARLLEGNRGLAQMLEQSQVVHVAPEHIGLGKDGAPPAHQPYASVLACSDARVPVELVFRCAANELFVVRVAGNVPGDECLGSLEYAAAHLAKTLRLAVVLGHTGCGAVTAAADTYLDPTTYPSSGMLRSVVDRILPSVRAADNALKRAHGGDASEGSGGRRALIELSIWLNTALAAMTVRGDLGSDVEYGVFDLVSREVTLDTPPEDAAAYVALSDRLAVTDHIREMLGP